jgi:flagellar hook-associated protein 1 FlgK
VSLSAALNNSVSGLRAAQAGMEVVAGNVSNSGTVGYTRRVLVTEQQVSGTQSGGVHVVGAQRVLDTLVQKQLRLEAAGAGYTGIKATYHASIDAMFDAPGATGTLPNLVSAFSTAVSTLVGNPGSYANRSGVVSAARDLAASLNGLSGDVQSLRQSAEDAIGLSVGKANELLTQIAGISDRIRTDPAIGTSPGLLDQRDGLINQLSQLMDVKVTDRANGAITIATTGGLQLFDGVSATTLSFDGRAAVGPNSAWNADPLKRSVGTITALDGAGRAVDVIAMGGIRSGELAGYLEMRDEVLPQAQTQLDALAAGMASALSDRPVASTPASAGAAAGRDIDLASLQNGNTFTLTYVSGGATRTATFVKTGSASAAAAATAGSDGAVGIDFSGGMASVATQIGARLGSGFTVSTPSGSTLRIVDDGAAGTTDVTGLAGSATVSGLASGSPELALFTDGGSAYTGSFEAGSQFAGFASRIALNPAVAADFGTLVAYSGTTPSGDTARPEHIQAALADKVLSFTGAAGIGGSSGRFTGTIADFATQIVATQAGNAISAANLDSGQKVVLNAMTSRMSEQSGVNIDQEMTQLIQLQTAYGANARVMSAAKEMLDMLMRISL